MSFLRSAEGAYCACLRLLELVEYVQSSPVGLTCAYIWGPASSPSSARPHNHAPQRPPAHTSDPVRASLGTMWDQGPSLLCVRKPAHFPAHFPACALACGLAQHEHSHARTSESTCELARFNSRTRTRTCVTPPPRAKLSLTKPSLGSTPDRGSDPSIVFSRGSALRT